MAAQPAGRTRDELDETFEILDRDGAVVVFGGDLMDPQAAARYRREILEPGGSRDAADLVESFLGRPYGFEAYREWLSGS